MRLPIIALSPATLFFPLIVASLASALASEPTFHKDVLPILQKHCQTCHRPGEIGPMPLLTYGQARPWAKAMREAVKLHKMPPWFADPCCGQFANDPSLTAAEAGIFDAWVASGAPEGASRDAPSPVRWSDGWNIPSPDTIITMPRPFVIPAKATIDYQYLILPTHFTLDRWVQAVEIRPGDASVIHHAVLYVREAGSSWLRDAPTEVMFSPPRDNPEARKKARATISDILTVYAPGSRAAIWQKGMGKKIPAGSDLVLQVHYTSKAAEARDETQIGMVFCTEHPRQRVLTLQMGNDALVIPPGEPNYRASVWGTLPQDALLLSLFPHMHLRGAAFEFQIAGPNGQLETLLRVRQYDFNWQIAYQLRTPRQLDRGARLLWTGYFDNSPNNPRNPDPAAEVKWGEQSWEEMMIGFFDVAVDASLDKPAFFVHQTDAKTR